MRSLLFAALMAFLSSPSFGASATASILAGLDASYDRCEPRVPQLKGRRDSLYRGLLGNGFSLRPEQQSKMLASLQQLRSGQEYQHWYKVKTEELASYSEQDLADTCQMLVERSNQSRPGKPGKPSASASDPMQELFGTDITPEMLVKWDAGHALCQAKQPGFRSAYPGTSYLDRVLLGYSTRPRDPQANPSEHAEGLRLLRSIRTSPAYQAKYRDEQAQLGSTAPQDMREMCRTFEEWFKPLKEKG